MTSTYSLSTDFSNSFNPSVFHNTIKNDSNFTTEFLNIDVDGDNININFAATLTTGEQTTLNNLVTSYVYKQTYKPASNLVDAIVANDSSGNYTSISDAFADGHTYVYVRNGTYVETTDIVIPNKGRLLGEEFGKVTIVLSGSVSVKVNCISADEETGTISITNNTKDVVGVGTTFTNLSVGNYILIGNNYYDIAAIVDDTHLTLLDTYNGKTVSGESYVGQEMKTGVNMENFIIYGSASIGLIICSIRHSIFRNIAIFNCATNVKIVKSGDISIQNIICSNSGGNGMEITSSFDVLFQTCNVYNNGGNGIELNGSCHCVVLESCSCTCNGNNGIYINNTCNSINIADSVFKQNNNHGIESSSTTNECMFDSNISISNGNSGMKLIGNNNICSNNNLLSNSNHGLEIGNLASVNANQIKSNTNHGIFVDGYNDCVFNANVCTSNGSSGIYINGDEHNIANNRCKSNNNGIELITGADDNIVSNNISTSNTTNSIVNNGANNIVNNNKS